MARGTLDIDTYRSKILSAHDRIKPYIHNTPLLCSNAINKKAGCEIYFKCENFQKIGAFKMRGAINAVLSYALTKRKKVLLPIHQVTTLRRVALSSKIVNSKAYIVMPKGAPKIKVVAVKGYGAQVYLCDNNEKSRIDTCKKIINKTGANFIHPFDNDDVISGQASCAKEIFEEENGFDFIICPVGGGGLASGTILSTQIFSPLTTVILGEPLKASDAYQSFVNNKLIPVNKPTTIADGLKTSLSERTFKIIKKGTKKIITVTEEEIVSAMKLIWERLKIVCEPSCSVPLAALLKEKRTLEIKKLQLS